MISSGASRHFAVLCNSLISLALGPPTSSVPGVATPWALVSPKAFKARIRAAGLARTRCSHCRNVSVLPKKLTVCDCDDSGPSHNFAQLACTSQQTQCLHSLSLSTHHEEVIAVHQNVRLQVFVEKWHGDATPREKSSILQKLERYALSNVGLHPEIRALSFAVSHARLAALVWCLRPAVERRRHAPRQHRSDLDSRQRWRSRKGLQIGKRLPDTQHREGFVEFPAEGLPRRSARPLCGAPPVTPDANGNVELRHLLCWYRST